MSSAHLLEIPSDLPSVHTTHLFSFPHTHTALSASLSAPVSPGKQPDQLLALLPAGAQTLAGMNNTGYAGGSVQFTTAAAQSVAIQRCLQEARVNASMPAASASIQARTALLAGNATAAADAIQSALCSADTATATAEVFAEVIASSVGCNGTVRGALQCKPCPEHRAVLMLCRCFAPAELMLCHSKASFIFEHESCPRAACLGVCSCTMLFLS